MTSRIAVALVLLAMTGCASNAVREAEQAKQEKLVTTNVQLANVYLQRGQVQFAKEKLDKALSIDPDDSQANNMMAVLQWRFKNYDAAEEHFRRAVREDKQNAEAQNNFGAFLCERNRVHEAEVWFRKAVSNPLYKTPQAAYENAGLCFYKVKNYAKAEANFRAALRIDPILPNSLYHMARISYDSGRTLAARGFLQRYFSAAQDTPAALLLAVRVERALKNKDEEASYALRLRGKFPTSPEAQQLHQSGGDDRG
jgi:type IV pilus assembly protein PilF